MLLEPQEERDARGKHSDDCPKQGFLHRPRDKKAPVGQKDRVTETKGLLGQGQCVHDDPVDQQDVQQDRHVAYELGVCVGEFVRQPVPRQAQHAQYESQYGGQRNSADGHEQGVEDPHQHGPEVCGAGTVFDQVLVDVIGGLLPQEAVAEVLAEGLEVDECVANEVGEESEDQRHGNNLDHGGTNRHVVPQSRQPALLLQRRVSHCDAPKLRSSYCA